MKTQSLRVILSLCLLLSGCASLTEHPAPHNQMIPRATRTTELNTIQSWNSSGVIALREKNQAMSANWQWQQCDKHYTLSFYGPLGADAFELTGSPGNVTLQLANGKTFHAASPEALVAEHFNYNLPVSNLYYWIRGLSTKGTSPKLDRYQRLASLSEPPWKINFLRYSANQQYDLPDKLLLQAPNLTIKIIVNRFRILSHC